MIFYFLSSSWSLGGLGGSGAVDSLGPPYGSVPYPIIPGMRHLIGIVLCFGTYMCATMYGMY
jgi:hypothetical protein